MISQSLDIEEFVLKFSCHHRVQNNAKCETYFPISKFFLQNITFAFMKNSQLSFFLVKFCRINVFLTAFLSILEAAFNLT
ncbi:hypothetical protein T4D_9316 [Trichinella pseudospiralis]|uniref:Uncharacterized protein n=1 Tax=Trichinella pseudospiralis TaxID=6337 RepID=A0A0V1G449_TRIPS|nr:hypothetical protein T4D_9316 [Trichinella pseudospiralis]